MLRAAKLQKKASKVGFDWPDDQGVMDKIQEELSEVDTELDALGEDKKASKDKLGEEIGDLLFSVINLARRYELDPEILLESTNVKFEKTLCGDGRGSSEKRQRSGHCKSLRHGSRVAGCQKKSEL